MSLRNRGRIQIGVVATVVMLVGGTALAPAAAEKSGGTLRIYNSTQPPSASIHEESTIATNMPFMAVFNNLVRFDALKPRNGFDTIVPELAESWAWDTTGTKLSLKLRSGVAWHDGKPFTAKDVQCTWHRLNGKEPDYLRRNPRAIWYENLVEVTVTATTRRPSTSPSRNPPCCQCWRPACRRSTPATSRAATCAPSPWAPAPSRDRKSTRL